MYSVQDVYSEYVFIFFVLVVFIGAPRENLC